MYVYIYIYIYIYIWSPRGKEGTRATFLLRPDWPSSQTKKNNKENKEKHQKIIYIYIYICKSE